MIKIVLELTEEEYESLVESVEERHSVYCSECEPEDEEEWDREGPIAASVFDKVIRAYPKG